MRALYNENNPQEYSQMCEKESKYGGVIEAREWEKCSDLKNKK